MSRLDLIKQFLLSSYQQYFHVLIARSHWFQIVDSVNLLVYRWEPVEYKNREQQEIPTEL